MATKDQSADKKWYESPLTQSIIIWIAHLLVGTWYLAQTKANLDNSTLSNKQQIESLNSAVDKLTVAMKSVEIGLVKFEANFHSLNETVEKQDRRIERLEQKR